MTTTPIKPVEPVDPLSERGRDLSDLITEWCDRVEERREREQSSETRRAA